MPSARWWRARCPAQRRERPRLALRPSSPASRMISPAGPQRHRRTRPRPPGLADADVGVVALEARCARSPRRAASSLTMSGACHRERPGAAVHLVGLLVRDHRHDLPHAQLGLVQPGIVLALAPHDHRKLAAGRERPPDVAQRRHRQVEEHGAEAREGRGRRARAGSRSAASAAKNEAFFTAAFAASCAAASTKFCAQSTPTAAPPGLTCLAIACVRSSPKPQPTSSTRSPARVRPAPQRARRCGPRGPRSIRSGSAGTCRRGRCSRPRSECCCLPPRRAPRRSPDRSSINAPAERLSSVAETRRGVRTAMTAARRRSAPERRPKDARCACDRRRTEPP